jgi:ribonuclease P protein component
VVVVYRRSEPGAVAEQARLGVVASRKAGNAVQRNRGKRHVREWFRRLGTRAPKGTDVVVILRAGCDADWTGICRELDGSLAKALRSTPNASR